MGRLRFAIWAVVVLLISASCTPEMIPSTPTPAPILPTATAKPTAQPQPTPSPPLTLSPTSPPPTSTPTPTIATPSALAGCCTFPEGVFRSLWQNNPQLQAGLSCPSSGHPRILPAAWGVQTSYQPFERGAMLWSNQIGWYLQPVIFVLHPDSTYQRFEDTYDPEADPVSGGETPPGGRIEPALGFGKVWRENPGVREALGWATAEETPGPGRFQQFLGGHMMWLSQREETYILLRSSRRYAVVDSPEFTLPTPTPAGDNADLLFNSWAPRDLPAGESAAAHEFAFHPDGTLTSPNCTASYELAGGSKVHVNAGGCTEPELPTGTYDYKLDASGDVLTLSQRFQHSMSGFSSMRWRQVDGDFEIELTGSTIGVVGERCSGTVEPQQGCFYRIAWAECERERIPLAAGAYEFTYVGNELTLSRQFESVTP